MTSKRGGARPGAGQPRKPADQAVSVRFSLALTPAEADEYRRRGATTWVRRMLQKSGSGEIVAICNDMLAECPPHKPYENYGDGWTDACNEIKWEIERRSISPLEMIARPNRCADDRRKDRDDQLSGRHHHLAAAPEKD